MAMDIKEEVKKAIFAAISNCNFEKKQAYNVFFAMNPHETEICKVIADLIDPISKNHDFGRDFLAKFLKMLGENPLDSEEKIVVDTEIPIPTDKKRSRRIDMVVRSAEEKPPHKRFIPFEFKVWSKDQKSQCADYFFNFAKGCGAEKIYYVSPHGHFPNPDSMECGGQKLKNGENMKLVSFFELADWLDDCAATDKLDDFMKKNLANFSAFLRSLTAEETELQKDIRKNIESLECLKKIKHGKEGCDLLNEIAAEMSSAVGDSETREKIHFAMTAARETVWPNEKHLLAQKICRKYNKAGWGETYDERDWVALENWINEGSPIKLTFSDVDFQAEYQGDDDAKMKIFEKEKSFWLGYDGMEPNTVFDEICKRIDKMFEILDIKY